MFQIFLEHEVITIFKKNFEIKLNIVANIFDLVNLIHSKFLHPS